MCENKQNAARFPTKSSERGNVHPSLVKIGHVIRILPSQWSFILRVFCQCRLRYSLMRNIVGSGESPYG